MATVAAPYGFVSSNKRFGPDPILVKDQLAHLQDLLKVMGIADFCRFMFWILRKNDAPDSYMSIPTGFWNKRLVPYALNRVQKDIANRLQRKNICLKMRQGGYTTFFIIVRLYLTAITEPGAGNLLISQNHHYATQHFNILKRVHRYVGANDPYDPSRNEWMRSLKENVLHTISKGNKKELVLDQLDSRILCDSAEIEEVGQGLTLSHVVGTEIARWAGKPEETLANLKEAIPADGTLDLESTANGMGGYFYEECMRARDPNNKTPEFNYFFHQWWWHDEYQQSPAIKEGDLLEQEKALRKKWELSLKQVTWRRGKIVSLRHNFAEKYPEDDITCFLLSGSSYFDRDVLSYRYRELQKYEPIATRRNGDLKIFEKRIKHHRYVIGGDPATGRQISSEDTDYCSAVVLDEQSGEEVAAFRARITPEDFAYDLAEMGRTYNNAMIAVERTGDGGTVILTLAQLGYNNQYKYKEFLKRDVSKRVIELEGFPTTPRTRPVALSIVRSFVRLHPELIWDSQFVAEALTFVRDEKGKPQAAEGAHDDTVSARWVAHFVRLVNLGYLDPLTLKSTNYDDDTGRDDEPEGEAAA